MGNIKENYELMFTAYPDIVNIIQLKEMLGIGINLAYKLVRNKTIPSLKDGLRREEILGLTGNAIDFKNKSITIRKTVGRGKDDGVTQFLIKDIPKNKSSYRTLPMFDFIADLLKKYKEKYKLNEKIFGNTYITDYKDFICLMDNGELVKPDYVDRTFSRILKEKGFRHIRLHDLRHSCATLLLRNGIPLPEIQKWLGHSNIITTQRYSHLDQNDKSIPANMIETKFNMSFISNDNKKEQISIAT